MASPSAPVAGNAAHAVMQAASLSYSLLLAVQPSRAREQYLAQPSLFPLEEHAPDRPATAASKPTVTTKARFERQCDVMVPPKVTSSALARAACKSPGPRD